MTDDRFRRVEEIFHAAMAVDPRERSSFLDDACGEDAGLRAEVSALIAHDLSAEAMFPVTAADRTSDETGGEADASLAGTRMGAYAIGAVIGTGGMGRVYRARDTRLGRDVAIKVLPRSLVSRRDRVARFEREARILAAQNHPHIATLFGIEDIDGAWALVMELVDGPTLAELIAGTSGAGLPMARCEAIARQIAAALDAAHQAGVVHRDLKPANIKITPGGLVKVLDFGLAKARLDPDAVLPVGAAETAEHTIVGTPAYMSPEQARGHPVDHRTDIWAFGCVLFEMLTGRAAFDRPTVTDTLSAVLHDEPDWRALPAATPPALGRLVRRCLEKAPAARLRDIGDAWLDEADSLAPARSRWRSTRARVAMMLFGTAAIVAGALWMIDRGRREEPAGEVLEFRVALPPGHAPWSGIAVTHDGRRVATGTFGRGPMIWIHELGAGTWTAMPHTEQASSPFWSPDGTNLGYFQGRRLWRTDLAGGPAMPLAAAIGWLGASWGTQDVIVFSSAYELYAVSASGGTPTKIPMPDVEGRPVVRSHPRFLPDGRRFIYLEQNGENSGIYVGSIDGALRTHLVDATQPAAFAPPDRVLFVRGTTLVAQTIDLDTLTLRGQPARVTDGAAPGFLNGRAAFSSSSTGVLAFVRSREGTRGQLTWFDHAGQPDGSIEQPESVELLNPAIAPDGSRVAVNRMDPRTGNWDVWTIDIDRGIQAPVTSNAATDVDPVWSPDGTQILFASDRNGGTTLFRKAADGTGPEEPLFHSDQPGALIPSHWSATGMVALSETRFPPANWAVRLLSLERRVASSISGPGVAIAYAGRFSPDGRWLAYATFATDRFEVVVRPVASEGPRIQVSRGGGTHPRWTQDGRRLFYWAQPGGVMVVDLEVSGGRLRAGEPRSAIAVRIPELIDGRPHYDVMPDGRRFLLRQPVEAAEPPIGIIVNWTRRVER